MAKTSESMFPGWFSMYRIKAPKREIRYWDPIFANADTIEHYCENVVDTRICYFFEDGYLTTLMLNPFPNRKNIFSPKRFAKPSCPILSIFASHNVIVGSTQPYKILPSFCWYGPLVALGFSM